MTEQSCASSGKFGEPALPTATLVEDDDGVEARAVTLEVAHEGGARNPDPQQAAQVRNQSGCYRWLVISVAWLFILTALTQFVVAMVVRAQGIEVIEYWIGSIFYPRAGNPWIGFLHLVTAGGFLAIVGCHSGRCLGCFEFLTFIILVVSFGWSFGERGVYNALKDYDQCIDNVDRNYDLDWGGDCYCWDYEFDGTPPANPRDHEVGSTPPVNADASTSCDNILEYVDNIFVSYILMTILMGFSVLALVLRCTVSRHAFYECLSMPYRR